MSLRYEQYAALKHTKNFLRGLLVHQGRINKTELRREAAACLRHFPFLHENGQPIWSRDEFTEDIK